MVNHTIKFLLLAILLSLALNQESVPAMEHKKVVEANHYYSDTDKQVTYNIANVEKQRALIFVLRNKTTSQASLSIQKNHVSIQLKSGDLQSDCKFENYDDLCVIKQVKDPSNMALLIKCQQLPCDISWTIFQPIAKIPTKTQPLQQLYELSDSNKHMIAIISCNDPAVKTFYQDVKVYSDNTFQTTKSNQVIYFLFNNQKRGFMFAEVAEASRHCANLAIYNVSDLITVSQKASIRDFVRNDSLSVFKLNQVPSNDFMLDASIHELDKTQPMKSSLQIKITGQTNGNRQTIQQQTVRPFSKKTQFQFKFLVKKIDDKYKNIQLELKSSGNIIMLNFQLISENRQQIEVGEVGYFHVRSGQKLLFKVPAIADAAADQKSFIYASNKKDLNVSQSECGLKSGCQFQVTASADVVGSLYLSQNKQQKKQEQREIVYGNFTKQVTKRGRQGQTHYYKSPLVAKKAIQLVVNNPNVIVYVATQGKCTQLPSQKCYDKIFNFHHPTIYQPQATGTLILAVQVLDNCIYTLTRLQSNQQYISLKDGQSFSYLMDDKQQKVLFKFKLDKKQAATFNLISPLNSLYLLVQNGKTVPNPKQMNIASTDGYITFNKNQVSQLQFTILVQKTDDHMNKFVHFTIIASTHDINMRLQPGIAHYQTLKPQQSQDFVFQFSPKQQFILTIYTHNAKAKQKINLSMLVNNKDQWTKIDPQRSFIINQAADVLQLKDVSKQLCESTGQQDCEIFIRIINTMDSEMDLTLNLIVKNSIIQLKDGIWQSYSENSIATSSNFYFYPKHANKSVEILYKSVFTDLRIAYSIWKADDKSINPTQWPFPKKIAEQNTQNQIKLFRPTKHISIDHESLKSCWPSCVVLIALHKNSTKVAGEFQSPMLQNGQFSIMASNNYIEIPQKTKVDVVLKQNQMKYFMIDLKYALEKEDSALTIFTSSTIGYYQLKANVYSQKNARCPVEQSQSDFRFGNLQTQIKVSTILKKIKQNQMDEHRNLYICLLAKAYTNSKFSIQYTSSESTFKILEMDNYETVSLAAKQSKIYQVSANQQYYIKLTRNKGFPFVNIVKCKQNDDYEKCLQSVQSTKQKGKQLVTKTQSFTEQPCQKCIIFVKLSSQQPSQLDIHLQSKYTQMELKQNKMISDFTNQNQQNRYMITAVRNQETIINIQVTEGTVEAYVTDFNKINITKFNKQSDKVIHIVIPAQDHQRTDLAKSQQLLGMPWLTPFGLSQTFTYLHLTIKAHGGKGATAYTVTYSSGQRQIYLQDGLITDYTLQPSKQTTFFYQNKNSEGHGYLMLSMDNSAFLHSLNLKMYYLTDQYDEETAVQIPSDIPPMRKKTPNPTVLYNIPAQKFIVIKMKNPSVAEQRVSIAVNHQQVILLPFNHQFPFPLHKKQNINLLVDVNNPGYLKITLKKCDQSNPQFSYTFDYEGFQKGEFTYTSILNDDPHFQYYVKVKEVGTLYVNLKSQQQDDSLVSVKVEYSPQKIKGSLTKPGNHGIIQYQLLDSATAQLTFTNVVCSGESASSCKRQYDYFMISATQQQQLYSQTVCPTHYFATAETTSKNPLPLNKIKSSADSNGRITFQYTLMDHISYVGVKGINSKTGQEIYYRPIQIVTIWGQISRTSTTHKFTIIGVSLCLFCAILVWCRRNARKGYKPLEEDD